MPDRGGVKTGKVRSFVHRPMDHPSTPSITITPSIIHHPSSITQTITNTKPSNGMI
jgi:hypothetical protein